MSGFDRTIYERDLGQFKPVARQVMALATALGWSVQWEGQKRRSAKISRHLPSGPAQYVIVPTGNVNSNRVDSWVKKILRYSTDEDIADLVKGRRNMLHVGSDLASAIALWGTLLMSAVAQEHETDHVRDRKEEEVPEVKKGLKDKRGLVCDKCGEGPFKNASGLSIHVGRKHKVRAPEVAVKPEPQTAPVSEQKPPSQADVDTAARALLDILGYPDQRDEVERLRRENADLKATLATLKDLVGGL